MIDRQNLKFVIYTPRYKSDVGGIIVLHKLCKVLTQKGVKALLWHQENPVKINSLKSLRRRLRYKINRLLKRKVYRSPYDLDAASSRDLHDAIVIYPEVVAGNPLESPRVVRWLLYKPGEHTGVFEYDPGDFFFYFKKEFDDPSINPDPDNELQVLEMMSDTYRQTNFGKRSGTCYMVRKGMRRELTYHPKDAILVDNYSHEQMAAAFNKYEYFISYDLYTLYSSYAAICGCKSVVVPMDGVMKESWQQEESGRYGVAYGFEEVVWAERTRGKLIDSRTQTEIEGQKSVEHFTEKCMENFYGTIDVKLL